MKPYRKENEKQSYKVSASQYVLKATQIDTRIAHIHAHYCIVYTISSVWNN